MRRAAILVLLLTLAGCGGAATAPPAATPTPDASDVNRAARAPALVYVYKVQGDDPYPWTLTVRADDTANLIVGGGHGGGDDKVVRLPPAVTHRTAQLVRGVDWHRIAGHTVEPGGFGGNDNMARYTLRHGAVTTVFAAGAMPAPVAHLVGLLDRIIDEDVGTVVQSDRHFSANGGILTTP